MFTYFEKLELNKSFSKIEKSPSTFCSTLALTATLWPIASGLQTGKHNKAKSETFFFKWENKTKQKKYKL